MNDLEIIEPSDSEMEFYEGENKSVTYYLRNNTDFAVRDIEFVIKSVKSDGEITEKTYAKVGVVPMVILSKSKASIDVRVRVPPTYAEYVRKDGEKKLSAFRLVAVAKGTKFIGE